MTLFKRMPSKKKRRWRILPTGKPGKRFEQRYDENRANPRPLWARVLAVGGAAVLLAVGLFFIAVPGPGIPFLLAGAGLLSAQSRLMARFLDRFELWVRRIAKAARHWWRRRAMPMRAAVVTGGVLVASGSAYGAWRILTG